MINTTKIKITHSNGDVSIKPWCTVKDDVGHLADAKESYRLSIINGAKIELYK